MRNVTEFTSNPQVGVFYHPDKTNLSSTPLTICIKTDQSPGTEVHSGIETDGTEGCDMNTAGTCDSGIILQSDRVPLGSLRVGF